MSIQRKIVAFSAVALFGAWVYANFDWLRSDDDAFVRFVLGGALSLAILFRPKAAEVSPGPRWLVPLAMTLGTLLALVGIIVPVNQAHWVGILLLIYACLRWSMHPRFGRDLGLGMILFYWVHPLPGQVFRVLQLKMQLWSVQGTEWFLHGLNQGAWADGYVLRTGKHIFEIPAICSGMTTAVTVLLFTLGTGLLLRFRWWENIVFVVLGLFQVLALNILRIAHMVYAADRMPPEWTEDFLHDTLGLYLVIALFLVGIEASVWRAVRLRKKEVRDLIHAGEVESPEKATVLPAFWRVVVRRGGPAIGIGFVILLIVGAVLKRRDFHRSEMIARTMETLIATDLTRAEAAAREVLELNPDNDDMRTSLCRVMLSREKYDAALTELEGIPEESWDIEESVLQAWAYLKIDRIEDARRIIEEIGSPGVLIPGLSMLKVEIAVNEDQPAIASANLVAAAVQPQMMERVRDVYPYLASREQWKAISESDKPISYSKVSHAIAAVFAHLRSRNFEDAATALELSVASWPYEPVFLDGLLAVAAATPGDENEAKFEEHFMRTVGNLSADNLAAYVEKCFELKRPDLAWIAFGRLQTVDADHPAVVVLPAINGYRWFEFRKKFLGFKAVTAFDTVDLRKVYRFTRHMLPLQSLWDNVPLGEELSTENVDAVTEEYLGRGLDLLSRQSREGTLIGHMRSMYPDLLVRNGQYDDAHRELDELEADFPDKRSFVRLKHAQFYLAQNRLDQAYESVRDHFASAISPSLMAHTILFSSVMQFQLGAYGMAVADEAERIFPDAPEVDALYLALLERVGIAEQALFVARRIEADIEPERMARLYYNTGRFSVANRLAAKNAIELRAPVAVLQKLFPLPAEWVLLKRWGGAATGAELAERTRELDQRMQESSSDYYRDLANLKLGWYRATDRSALSDVAEWERIGRDGNEKGVALHELAILLAQDERFEEAVPIVKRALRHMPRAAVLWRSMVMLTEGDPEVVREASQLCPYDPEIWLARIIVEAKDEKPQEWFIDYLEASAGKIMPMTMARAGDYLFRVGKIAAASDAARRAIDSGQGLVTASMLGLRCAISTSDVKWSLDCAGAGARDAVEAWPFYMTIVDIKLSQNVMDADLEQALNHLAEQFPDDIRWSEGLIEVYYRQGRFKRAISTFERLIAQYEQRVNPEVWMLTAEAARLAGDGRLAARIAARAYALHPDHPKVINNLVYYLSTQKETLFKARDILEKRMLTNIGGSYATLDTAAVVYLRLGDFKKANNYINRALALVEPADIAWPEINVNAAEIMIAMRRYNDARTTLMAVQKDPNRSSTLEQRINRLLMVIERQTQL